MTESSTTYTKLTLVSCEAKSRVYYQKARRWGWVHWGLGIFNGLVSSGLAVVSFLVNQKSIDSTVATGLTALILSITTTITTSIKAGHREQSNENAGDAYAILRQKILQRIEACKLGTDSWEELHGYCNTKMTDYIRRYPDPPIEECSKMEAKIRMEENVE